MWIRFVPRESFCSLCKNKYLQKSGRTLFCEKCRKIKRKQWNKESYKKHEKEIIIKRHLYDRTEKAKIKYRRYRIKIRERNKMRYRLMPENKRKARYYVKNAIRAGKLKKSEYCEKCGKKDWGIKRSMIEAHHYKGYNQEYWLVVEWLCTDCHKKADLI